MGGVSPVLVQIRQGCAESRCRCGSGGRSGVLRTSTCARQADVAAAKETIAARDAKVQELEEHNRDLMFFIEANNKIQQSEGHELRDGTLCTETVEETASPRRRLSKKK